MSTTTYVRYSDDVEQIAPDEDETADKIVKVMRKGGETVEKREGRAFRTSHAKAHAIATGTLRIREDLPPELRQGLFAQPASYRVVARMAHVPGELLDDRKVSTPRGFALKVLGVRGEMIAQHEGGDTQDWVLSTGDVFNASNAKVFLGEITMTEAATPMPEGVKGAVSSMSASTNAMLKAMGGQSANLDFYGHPKFNPLTETYYSQAPIRYGDYIAKLRLRPVSPQREADQKIDIEDENGLRTEVVHDLRDAAAEFALEIQLCTDLDAMPVENAHTEWSQDDSPYREVARLTLPAQTAYSETLQALEDRLSFSPAHSLAAHRPLGSIMRARLRAYGPLADWRRQENGTPQAEPTPADLPPERFGARPEA